MTTLIYIAGYGRSGSTLLDMILGSHPDAVGMGELTHIFDSWLSDNTCSCRERYRNCEFWSEVMPRWSASLPNVSITEAATVTRQVEDNLSSWRKLLPQHKSTTQKYGLIWQTMIDVIAEVDVVTTVIDSSKSTRTVGGRALALANYSQLDVKVIHLVRDPRAVMWSYLRGNNIKLEAGHAIPNRGGVLRAILGWNTANFSAARARDSQDNAPLLVRYEDFVEDPYKELHAISQSLMLDFAPIVKHLKDELPIKPDHGVAGNRLRRKGLIKLKKDEEWKDQLPNHARLIAQLNKPFASKYGYPHPRKSKVNGNTCVNDTTVSVD